MNVNYKLNLDVYKDENYESIVVAQNDDKSRIIECKLYADSRPVALSSSVTAAFNATVNNVIVAENVPCIVADNAVKITLAKSMLQLAGMMQCELVLSENDTILTTQHFSVYVNKSVINSKSKYEPNGGTLATKDDINAAIEKAKSETDNKLNGINADVNGLKSDLGYITDKENLFDKTEIVTGYRLTSSGQPYAETDYYYSNYIPVEFGKTYKRNSPILDEKHRVCFYNFYNGFNFIGTVWSTNEIVIDNANVTHIRFCGLQSEVNTTTLFGEVTAKDNAAREKVNKLELDVENANRYCENIVTVISSKTDMTGVNIYRSVYADKTKVQDGDVLYLYAIVKSSVNGATKLDINSVNYVNNPNNDYYEISHSEIAKQTAGGNYEFNIKYVYPTSVTSELLIKKALIINLTSLFGNNCEPSKEDMDKIVFGLDEEIDKPLTKLLLKNVVTMQSSLIRGLRDNNVYASKDGNIVITSIPNYYWNEWSEIGNYGQENKGSIPIYNKVHGTLETDGMLSVLPIWGCWSENSAAKGTGSKYHGGHVFHGWTTDRKHRLTMLQNIYRDDEAAIFNYIPGDKANNGEGTFLRLRLGADNIGKGVLIEPVLNSNNHYAYTRYIVFGRLNIQSDKSKYDVNGDGESAYTKGLPVNTIPSSSTSDGIKGDFTFDKNYAYFCVDDNKWKRIPLEEW